jgi:hypothetical protein
MRMMIISLAVFFVGACGEEPVGRVCDLGATTPAASEVVIASGSLDCISRTCLRVPLTQELPPGSEFPTGTSGLCTAECSSDDECEGVPETPCAGGFTCAVAVSVGPFCCKKFCVCKDYGVLPESAACDPDDDNNTCVNLPGR